MSLYVATLCTITNPHDNFKIYVKKAADLVTKYGAKYVIRGAPLDGADAPFIGKSLIVLEFASKADYDAYKAEYAELLPLQEGSGVYEMALYNGV